MSIKSEKSPDLTTSSFTNLRDKLFDGSDGRLGRAEKAFYKSQNAVGRMVYTNAVAYNSQLIESYLKADGGVS